MWFGFTFISLDLTRIDHRQENDYDDENLNALLTHSVSISTDQQTIILHTTSKEEKKNPRLWHVLTYASDR